jgi:hypothetical protein
MDCSQAALFVWPLFPIPNFEFTNICLYKFPPSALWSSFESSSLGIIVKYLTHVSLCYSAWADTRFWLYSILWVRFDSSWVCWIWLKCPQP